MNTIEKNKSLLFATLSIALLIGSGVLLNWTLNDLYRKTTELGVLLLSLLSVFIYVSGATILGRSIRTRNMYHSRDEIEGGVIFAFLLIAAGALMICFNAGLLNPDWKPFFISWQMAIFVVGCICFCRFHFIWGTIFAAAGLFFLIEKAAAVYPVSCLTDFTATFWPAIFIVLGIVIVLSYFVRSQSCCKRNPKGFWKENYIPNENENYNGKINYRFVFSGSEQVILDQVFKGGTIDATFGGMELDLRRTSLAEGKTFLHVNAVFGGVEISAPDNWDIEIVSKSFAGGVSDNRVKVKDIDHSRKLVIVAKCSFGGITIR